jgi:hypothetical protein
MALIETINGHRISLKTLDPHIHREEVKMVGKFFGKPGLDLLHSLHRPDRQTTFVPDEVIYSEMDKHFFNKLGEEFHLKPEQEIDFYRRQLKRANKVINHLMDELDLPVNQYGLKNETALYSDNPSERLILIADVKGVKQDLRFEVARQMLLALAIAPLDIRASEDKLATNLSGLQFFLNENLYLGKIGETSSVSIFSEHDNVTNTVINYHFNPFANSNTSHIKETVFNVRDTFFGSKVLTQIRHKGENESLIKAIERSFHNGKPIDILESVKDSVGMQFVVMGDKTERDRFINNFEKLIVNKYNNLSIIEPNNTPDNDRGQNKSIFERRSLLRLKGLSVPIEIIYYSLEEYLNSTYEVGSDNQGRAHVLYELRRLAHTAGHLFPKEIYGEEMEKFIADKIAQEADLLKFKNTYYFSP